VHLLQAYSGTGHTAQALIVKSSTVDAAEIRPLLQDCAAEQVYVIKDALFDAVAQVASPAGIMALVKTPPPPEIPDRIGDALLLEEIQDPGNMGSILRSAAAAGIDDIFLSRKSIFAWSPKVLRAGMGAHFSLRIYEDVDLDALLKRRTGLSLATDAGGVTSVSQARLDGPVAWIFGNEGAGISPTLLEAADMRVCIPMPGIAESLNVAAAAAVCLFEQVRQRTPPTGLPGTA
jgi:TrmH family RNA methyltransferase